MNSTYVVRYDPALPIHQQLVPLPARFPVTAKQGSKAFAFPSHNLMVSVQAGWEFKCSIKTETGQELAYPEWNKEITDLNKVNALFRRLGSSWDLKEFPHEQVQSYEIIIMQLTDDPKMPLTPTTVKTCCPAAVLPSAYGEMAVLPMGVFIPTEQVEALLKSIQ